MAPACRLTGLCQASASLKHAHCIVLWPGTYPKDQFFAAPESFAWLWRRHDFVVVETIDFYDDEDAQLPEPMTQRDVILLNKAAQEQEVAQADAAEAQQDGKDKEDNMEVTPLYKCWHV